MSRGRTCSLLWKRPPGGITLARFKCHRNIAIYRPTAERGLSRRYNLPFRCDPHTIPMSLAPNNPLRTQCTIHARARITFCLDGF